MAQTYMLDIEIDQAKVIQFSKQNYKFCLATGVASDSYSDATFNVVADTQEISTRLQVTWSEKYAIGASTTAFKNGAKLFASTGRPVPIKLGQSYTQPPEFIPGVVNDDSSAPPGGFRFINQAKKASAIVYKLFNGDWSPIYISRAAPLPPGIESLVPKNSCAIWFSVAAEASNMVSEFATTPLVLDLSNNSTGRASAKYTADGAWVVVSNS